MNKLMRRMIAIAALSANALLAQDITAQATPQPAVPAKPDRPAEVILGLGNVTAVTVTVKPSIDGQLISVVFKEGELVQAGQVLASMDPGPGQAQLAQAQIVDNALVQLNDVLVIAPITGVAGRRLLDPGNMIHTTDGIVKIAQVQPIAVLFTIPEDALPQVRARLIAGAHPIVEAWNRNDKVRLSSGVLTAIDNQIDEETGTVKLKASFDNKDRRLRPNQIVNVHLLLNPQ